MKKMIKIPAKESSEESIVKVNFLKGLKWYENEMEENE